MARFAYDIELGKIPKNRLGKTDVDAFSGKVLHQFMNQGVTSTQFNNSMKFEKVHTQHFGTMANFMKTDARLQASSNQFTQRNFRINKKSLEMTDKFHKLDKKVRGEERTFYIDAKKENKEQRKIDIKIKAWQTDVLKHFQGAKHNTETLQFSKRYRKAKNIIGGIGFLAAGGMSVFAKAMVGIGNFATKQLTASASIGKDKTRLDIIKERIYKDIKKTAVLLYKSNQKDRIRQKRVQDERDKEADRIAKLRAEHGIGARQTHFDSQVLRARERKARQDSRYIGGFFSTDEEKQARKNLQQEAKEHNVLRKRGFSLEDIERAENEGVSRSDLVASGKHNRKTFKAPKTVKNLGRGAAAVGKFGRGGLRAVGPRALTGIAGAGLAVHEIKQHGGISGAIDAAAGAIPVLGMAKDTFDTVADLLPQGVKDWFTKVAGAWFQKMWSKVSGGGGGKSGIFAPDSALGMLGKSLMGVLNLIGSGVKSILGVVKSIFLNDHVQAVFTSFGGFLIESGKTLIMGATGVLNFLTDIFGEKKARFGEAFMAHLWPPIQQFGLNLIPAIIDLVTDTFNLIGTVSKNLIIGMAGEKVAGFFGLRKETLPGEMGKATRLISEGQERATKARVKMTNLDKGPEILAEYFDHGKEAANDKITLRHRQGELSYEDAEVLRSALNEIHSAEADIAAGKKIRQDVKEQTKQENLHRQSASHTGTPATSQPLPPGGAAQKGSFSGSLQQDLRDASAAYGVPLNYLETMAWIESRGNPNAVSPTGATGIFQFIRSTGRAYGLVGPGYDNRKNQRLNVFAGAAYAADNAKGLARSGLPNTSAYLYLAHQQGLGGAKLITTAALNGTDVPPKIRRNMDVNGGRGLTPAQFLDKWKTIWAQKSGEPIDDSIMVASTPATTTSSVAEAAGISVKDTAASTSLVAEPSTSSLVESSSGAAQNAPQESGVPGFFASMASKIMSQGSSFASGLAELPNSAMAILQGNGGSAFAEAMRGAGLAADAELQRMRQAMENALSSDPAIQQLAYSTGELSSYTQEMSHREDKNAHTFTDKELNPFKQAFETEVRHASAAMA